MLIVSTVFHTCGGLTTLASAKPSSSDVWFGFLSGIDTVHNERPERSAKSSLVQRVCLLEIPRSDRGG